MLRRRDQVIIILIILFLMLVSASIIKYELVEAPEIIFYDYMNDSFETINVTLIESSTHFNLYVQSNITLPNTTLNYFNLSQIESMYWILDTLYDIELSNISIVVCIFPLFPPGIVGYYYFLLGDAIYLNYQLLILQKFDLLRATVIHELSHLFMNEIDLFEGPMIQEGIACFVETMAGYSVDYYVERYLRHPETSLTNFTGSLESYGAVYSWIAYLNQTYGFEDIRQLAQSKSHGMTSVQQAFNFDNRRLREVFSNFIVNTFKNFSTMETLDSLPPWSAYRIKNAQFMHQHSKWNHPGGFETIGQKNYDYYIHGGLGGLDWIFNFENELDLNTLAFECAMSFVAPIGLTTIIAFCVISYIIIKKRKSKRKEGKTNGES